MSATREQVEALKTEVEAAKRLLDAEDFEPARDAYVALLAKAADLGLESSYLHWGASLAWERHGDPEASFRAASAAVLADPMHPAHCERFVEAATALRRDLCAQSLEPAQHAAVGRAYALLVHAGEADARCHVAMARVHLAAGRLDAAWKLLESTTLLEPSLADAWTLRAEAARRRGDEPTAASSETRARTLGQQATPFGIPSPNASC